MEQKILDFMKENDIDVFVETDRAARAARIEKPGSPERWDRFQLL